MIPRTRHLASLRRLLRQFPVVAVIGARQIGKTTLARQLVAESRGPTRFFDLEDVEDLGVLSEPMLALRGLRGLVVLDEVQRRPDIFPALRVLADRRPAPARFLVLGSASPALLRQGSESLAGRLAYYELEGLSLGEVGSAEADRLWLRGGFPRSFVARTHAASAEWRRGFIRSFVERDMPQMGIQVPARALTRFWSMLAHYHGQIWNAAEFARALGTGEATARRHLDLMSATFVVRTLQPWFENLGKRQVKAPKVYVSDSGILHALLRMDSPEALERHPKVGASWEGFAMDAVISRLSVERGECYFWRTHTGAELDLLIVRGKRRWGFEFKRNDAPGITPSMRVAMKDLKLDSLDVVHPGRRTFALAGDIRAVALRRILEDLRPLPAA
jgi:predicted AAA+ superfamily ATPase